MVDPEVTENIKVYFNKLRKVIMFNADFSFFDYRLIKKTKIDDILCCILATFPDSYKRIMKQKEGTKYSSVLAYNLLYSAVKNKFILNSDVYLVSYSESLKYIDSIIRDIEKDINKIDKTID